MKDLFSIEDIDLAPKPGKKYWRNCHREWREEFIYFLMVDRFHDNADRKPASNLIRTAGYGDGEQLKKICGGTIKGISNHIEYIKGLGCTAIWLSPVLENNPESYHGYAIQNYLSIDARFGTKEDLVELIEKAHALDMRVFLDIVLHHTGNNWSYPENENYYYFEGTTFPFGNWRNEELPMPTELRNPSFYYRKGETRNFDAYPETKEGDFFSYKTLVNDESPEGLAVLDILVKIHCYWMRELDFDGFRLDAVKHMGELAVARFCSKIREFAYTLDKRNFFLFGELVAGDEFCNKYLGPSTTKKIDDNEIYFGLNSVLDFPLYNVLSSVIKGTLSPLELVKRYDNLSKNSLNRDELGKYLITFIDNHDQVASSHKARFGTDAFDEQIIAGIGYLLCAIGTPCIYYGTEQGFSGKGEGDQFIREAMFDLNNSETNSFNSDCLIYKEIKKIADIRNAHSICKFGSMYFRQSSVDGGQFYFPINHPCIIAFSRILFQDEMLVAYNTSIDQILEKYVIVDFLISKKKTKMRFLYGGEGDLEIIQLPNEAACLKILLKPMQFVVLINIDKSPAAFDTCELCVDDTKSTDKGK